MCSGLQIEKLATLASTFLEVRRNCLGDMNRKKKQETETCKYSWKQKLRIKLLVRTNHRELFLELEQDFF